MWRFLGNEMLVILAMTEDANRTDSEIADAYGMKKGTVSAVRRRLLDAGAIHYVYVPAFNRLGCEILGFHYGMVEPAVPADVKANHYMEFCSRTPQIYHALIGGNWVVFFTVLRNATDLETFVQSHNAFFSGSRRFTRAKLSHAIFPYAMSRISPIPQFSSMVHDFFKLDVHAPKKPSISVMPYDRFELGVTEAKVMQSIVSNPSASDREVACEVKLSRQAVTRTRNNLVDEGLLTKICVPRLYRWGFEIYAVAHPKFVLDMGWEKRLKNEPPEVIERSFYTLSKAGESVGNFMVSKFSEYSDGLETMLAWYHKVKLLEEPPEIMLFSLDRSTELRTFDYAPAIRNLLGGKDR